MTPALNRENRVYMIAPYQLVFDSMSMKFSYTPFMPIRTSNFFLDAELGLNVLMIFLREARPQEVLTLKPASL